MSHLEWLESTKAVMFTDEFWAEGRVWTGVDVFKDEWVWKGTDTVVTMSASIGSGAFQKFRVMLKSQKSKEISMEDERLRKEDFERKARETAKRF